MARISDQVKAQDSKRRKRLRDKLKEARLEAGYTQQEVAYIMGWSQPFFSKVEDRGRIEFVRLERLAAVYNKPLSWFGTLDPNISNPPSYADENEPCYRGLTRKEWKQAARTKQEKGKGHWPVPVGWGLPWIRKLYEYEVENYKGSAEYVRIVRGEDFCSVFKWDGRGYVITGKPKS